jgi:hypothetical protein
MADSEPSVRQRKGKAAGEAKAAADAVEEVEVVEDEVKPNSPGKKIEDEDAYSPVLDIFRVLTFLFIASCGLSYVVSGGESWFWGMKDPPKYLQMQWWKGQVVSWTEASEGGSGHADVAKP